VVLLEQGTLSCGTTWHAAGLVGQLRASEAGTRLVQYSCELYDRIEAETGLSAGYRRCGGLTVARTPERMVTLRRTAASAAAYGLDCDLLTPDQAGERYPLIRTDDLVGAIWLPATGEPTRPTSPRPSPRVPNSVARRSSSAPGSWTSTPVPPPAGCGSPG
jgi:4-methylaminobutanoate oxidase (formaldehyde-forming)